MKLIDRARRQSAEQRSIADVYGLNGTWYPLNTTYTTGDTEPPPSDFYGYVQLYKNNPVVFACMATRLALFTEARFAWRRIRDGVAGDLFGNRDLRILERPDRSSTTATLLARMEQDASLVGNSFWVRLGDPTERAETDRLVRLKPQHTTIVLGSRDDVEDPSDDPYHTVLGYIYDAQKGRPQSFLPDQVAHYAPTVDPEANHRGMSWLTPVIREIRADDSASSFKNTFYTNAATPNMVIKVDRDTTLEQFQQFKQMFDAEHTGGLNAFKTLWLGGGADATVIGSSFRDMTYTEVQQAGENRICIAANVPAVMVGLQAGLDAATYSNMGQARRTFSDLWARPAWHAASAALETVLDVPSDAMLDVDVDNISFLRDDGKDIAEIQKGQATAIKQLTEAGFDPDSVVDAVTANDMARLRGNHSGLQSVQLMPPASGEPATNGSQPASA